MREAPRSAVVLDATGTAGPRRRCVGCRRVRLQIELLRIARTRNGVVFDRKRRLPGRGAYVCPDPDCIDEAARRGGRAVRSALRGVPEVEVQRALDDIRTTIGVVGDAPERDALKERNA